MGNNNKNKSRCCRDTADVNDDDQIVIILNENRIHNNSICYENDDGA